MRLFSGLGSMHRCSYRNPLEFYLNVYLKLFGKSSTTCSKQRHVRLLRLKASRIHVFCQSQSIGATLSGQARVASLSRLLLHSGNYLSRGKLLHALKTHLRDHTNGLTKGELGDLGDPLAINHDVTADRVVETEEKANDCRLTAACLTNLK